MFFLALLTVLYADLCQNISENIDCDFPTLFANFLSVKSMSGMLARIFKGGNRIGNMLLLLSL